MNTLRENINKYQFQVKLVIGFLMLIITIQFIFFHFFQNSDSFTRVNKSAVHAKEVIKETEQVLSEIKDIESGTRAYEITGNEMFLKPYITGYSDIYVHLNNLKNITKINPAHRIKIIELGVWINMRLNRSQKLISLIKDKKFEEAKAITNTAEGELIMNNIKAKIAELQKEENDNLEREQAQNNLFFGKSSRTMSILEALIIVILFMVFVLIDINFRNRKKIESSLLGLNNELEKRVEERTAKLEENEKLFKALVENDYGMTSLMNEKMETIYRSPTNELITGWTEEERKKRGIYELIHPDYREYHKQKMQEVLANPGVPVKYELKSIHKNGSEIWLEGVSTNRLNDPNVKGIITNLHDITKRNEATQQLEQNEKLFRAMVENTHDIISLSDKEGKIIYASPSFEKLIGYPLKDIVGRGNLTIMHPDYAEDSMKAYETLINNPGLIIPRTNRFRKTDGEYIDLEGTAVNLLHVENVNAIVNNYRDVTARKAAEKKLEQSEKKYRHIFESSPMPMFVVDMTTHKYLDVNEAAIKHYGYSREELLSMSAKDLRPAEEVQRFVNTDFTVKGENYNIGLWKHKKKDGTVIDVEMTLNQVHFGDKLVNLVLANDITEQHQAEEKILQMNEELEEKVQVRTSELSGVLTEIKDLYNNAPCGYFSVDSNIYISNINQTLLDWLGYTQEEVIGKMKYEDMLSPESRENHLSTFEVVFAEYIEKGFINDMEFVFQRKDGTTFPALVNSMAVLNEKGEFIQSRSTIFDNTKHKRAEDNLKENNIFLDTVIENIPNMLFVKDAKDLKFVRFNKAGENLLGYKHEDLIGKNDYDFFPKEEADFFTGKDREIINKGELVDIKEEKITTVSGEKWLHTFKVPVNNKDGKPAYLIGISEDITLRKEHEEAIRKSNELFSNLFNYNPAALTINREDDGRIITCNNAFLDLFGFSSKEEVIGKSSIELNLQVEPQQVEDNMEAMKQNDFIKDKEICIRNKQGDLLWVNTSILKIDIDDKPCFLSVTIDITARKHAEGQLKIINSELEAFTYSVSHDLRAPLRSIDGFAQVLQDKYVDKLDDEAKRYMSIVMNNAKKMAQLIDDLLMFSRLGKQTLQKTMLDMNEIVHVVCAELIKPQDIQKIELKIQQLPTVSGDRSMIKQVFANLIGNSIKYSSKKEQQIIEIGYNVKNNETVYYVKDNGAGFNMEYYDKLFGVFQRLHSAKDFEGTGVGLSIVHRILTKHGGNVWAESKVNEGATFYFSLPKEDKIDYRSLK